MKQVIPKHYLTTQFEGCRRLAEEKVVPLKAVLQEATFAFWKELGSRS